MLSKCLVIAASVLFGAFTTVIAQSPEVAVPTLGSVERVGTASTPEAVPTFPEFVLGWNFVHASGCQVLVVSGTPVLYLWSAEGTVLATANLTVQNAFAPACQTGNRIGFHAVDASGAFDSIFVYSFK